MTSFREDLLAGRTALITGGGTGLGFAMAKTFASLGAKLALASRNAEHVEPAAERIRQLGAECLALVCDVRDPEQVEATVARTAEALGALDILVNNAAGNFLVTAEDLSAGGWRAVTRIVLDGTWFCSHAAFPRMKQQGGGAILNIVATYADGAGPLTVHSAAGKAGVLGLTRTLAVEWAEHGIRVNALAPGPVDTEGAGSRLWASGAARRTIEEKVPMGRFGSEDEIATAAAFLVSNAASYINGILLPVDGGLSLGRGHLADEAVVGDLLRPKDSG